MAVLTNAVRRALPPMPTPQNPNPAPMRNAQATVMPPMPTPQNPSPAPVNDWYANRGIPPPDFSAPRQSIDEQRAAIRAEHEKLQKGVQGMTPEERAASIIGKKRNLYSDPEFMNQQRAASERSFDARNQKQTAQKTGFEKFLTNPLTRAASFVSPVLGGLTNGAAMLANHGFNKRQQALDADFNKRRNAEIDADLARKRADAKSVGIDI